ncbi:MAG TPA: hypothetical protein VE174_14595 [Actinomycetota bacterium]|nr:hypothetical protein [Actinomycetota bacterium]
MDEPLRDEDRKAFTALLGEWTTEASHPMLPDTVVAGVSIFAWLEGEQFLVNRAHNHHELFPDSVSVIGNTEGLHMHYFDSRGVHRVYDMSFERGVWRIWRDHPGFSQRFTGTFEDGGHTIAGQWQLNEDGSTWNDDLAITYRR